MRKLFNPNIWKTNQNNIKLKVVAGYALILLAIIFSGYIAYQSYSKLLTSIYSLSKPDYEITRINRLLTNLSEAENHIRIFSLTRQEKHLNNYVERMAEVQMELDSLKTRNYSSNLSEELIDSMSSLLEMRSKKFNSFTKLKQVQEKRDFYTKANQKLSLLSDTSRTKVKLTTTTTSILDTIETISPAKKRKGFFKWVFGKKERKESKKTVVQHTKIKTDTSYIPKPDSIYFSFKSILHDARQEELRTREILSREELQLIDDNSRILGKVKKILTRLEQERLQQIMQKTKGAHQIANRSILTISVILIIGFILGVLFIFFILSDITRSNYYRKALLAAKGKAEKLAKVKEDFLATMSHEIRTPLNAVIGFADQLDKTPLKRKQKTFLEAIKSSSDHLLGLINEILDLSKIEAGKIRIENQPFSPFELIIEVHNILELTAREKGLKFSQMFKGKKNILFKGDSFRLKQVLINLCNNAIKFTPKGKVEIWAETVKVKNEEKHLFRVIITDTGIGIAKEKLETIFESFNQAEPFSTRKYGGTGLGLSISRRLVHLMHGDLFVSSVPGKGSKFTIEIPLQQAFTNAQKEKDEVVISPPAWLLTKRILVVDDDPYSLLLLKTIFSKWKLLAEFMNNGILAWEQILKNNFDLILSDIHMPGSSGLELCSQLRKIKDSQKSKLPVIAITANIRAIDQEKYLAAGMTKCLTKPFNETTLLQTLLDALGKPGGNFAEKKDNNSPVLEETLYDLEEIKKFTENNPQQINQVLQSFIENAEKNLMKLQEGLQNKDSKQIGETAHKMLTSFRQLKIRSITPVLEQLEGFLYKKNPSLSTNYLQIEMLINKVQKNLDEVLGALKRDMQTMQSRK